MSGKRANIFGQGKPERPYEERESDPADLPQRATAAQLAARKIKSAKPRRPAGAASTPPPTANFGAPLGSGINFGASAPAIGTNNSNGIGFGGNGAFGGGGGGATNSFPPAQSAAPSNSFSSSSFPAFGSGNQSTGFNPQPPATNFNFTSAGNSNPFAATNSAPMTNGSSSAPSMAFGGGSVFGAQQPSNPFGGLSQNNTASAAGPGSLFSTSSAAPSTSMFSTTNAAPTASTTTAPATTPFSFAATTSAAQNTSSTPATSSLFKAFGTSSQNNAAPARTLFGGFGSNAQQGEAQQEKTLNNVFTTGTSAQGTENAATTAPAPSLFNYGTNATSAAPSSSMFGTSTPSSAPTSNPFASLPTAAPSTSAPFSFGQQTPQAQGNAFAASSNPFGGIKLPEQSAETPKPSLFSSIKAPQQTSETPKPSLFSSIKATQQSASTASETPKGNLFSGLAKPPPAATTPGFSLFGAPGNKAADSDASEKPSIGATSNATKANQSSLFHGFNTPQPTKKTEAEKPQAGLFSAQPKTSTGIFSQTFQPEHQNSGNAFKTPSAFSSLKPQSTSSLQAPKDAAPQQSTTKEATNPFPNLPAPSTERSSLFAPPKEQPSAPSPSSMPSLMGGASSSTETMNGPELPKIPKAHVPKEWAAPSSANVQGSDNLFNIISSLTMQLQDLNEKYRAKMNSLSPTADWSSLSLWHYQHSSAIKKKIDIAKKQRAAAKGVTGNESGLSTKRRVNDEGAEDRNMSPSKRARPADVSATPTPQPSTPTPRFNPPATATSNIFAKAISNKPSAPSESTGLFAPKAAEASAPTSTKPAAPVAGFKPFIPSNSTSTSQSPFSASGFKPSTSTGGSSGFQPSTTGSSGGFASQFASKAKTYEQLAAERKKKAKDADYDSDDETEEEWSARYDKEEAERLAKEKAEAAAISGFSLPASGKTSGTATPASNPFAGLAKPATGTSTPNGLFTPRPASPAPSTGSQSVFDAPSTTQAASPNIFGHLSSRASSNSHDDSDDEGHQAAETSPHDKPVGSVEPTTPPKRKFGTSESEADESAEEIARHKKRETVPKGSLLSRMTRLNDDGSESEKENINSASVFGQANGTTTPTNKPFNFFDFGAAGAKTAPPKSDTFAGDQTFKAGTPIKFGNGPATEQKAPIFQFQPATASTTPSKPPPTSLFNFGASASGSSLLVPNAGLSGLSSAPSSVFSSRAATPLSEAETSAASATEDDEEVGKQEQVDLSKLTQDELATNDVVFETEQALAKRQVDQGDGTKSWENFARGPLYILKDKVTGKCFVRIRLTNGQIPLNYNILPALKATVTGSSGKMVAATMPKKEGGITPVYLSVKTPEIAKEFADRYNESLPS